MLVRARQLAAALFVAVLSSTVAAGTAQNGRNDPPAEQAAEAKTGDNRPSAKESRPTGIADVDTCKQQAQGLEGPARARFMTACLKRN